jgi:hypothetical protein
VAHTSNPSYSGGRDQEDHSLKPARQIIQYTKPQNKQKKKEKKNSKKKKKKRLVEWLRVGPEFKPQYRNNNKNIETPWSRVMISCTPLLPYPVSLEKS